MARSEKDISFWDDFEDESAEPDDITLAYVAGLFDGEGSVGVGIDYKVRITLCNTDEKVIKWLKSLFGGCASDKQAL